MMKIETIKLNLIPTGAMPVCHASQYDDGRQFRAEIYSGLRPYIFDGNELISLVVRKPDNNLVTMDIANVYGGKRYIEFASTEQMCAVAGQSFGEITLEKNGVRIGSLNFFLQVEKSPDEGGIQSQSEINNLARQVHDIVVEELEDNGASETGYDNTESGLEATNVQDAIDEVNTKIENIPSVDAYTKEESDQKFATISSIPTKTSQLQNDSDFAQIDDSEASASKVYSSDKVDDLLDNKYEQKLTQTLKVGENILTEASVVLGANWNGTLAGGFTHSSGSTASLEFNVPTTNNKPYLVSFEASNVSNANVLSVCIGNTPLVDIYNGGSVFYIGIVSDGGNLIITPKSTYNGTITNLKLREVANEGDEVTFEVKNVNTNQSESGISGFWNVAIGADNFSKNENGSRNVAVGYASLNAFKSGTRNLALGTFAMNRLESGDMNIAVGADSMWYAKKAKDCIALGANSLNGVGTDLEHDIAIGQDSMAGITTGKQNIGIGYGSMASPQNEGINNATCVGAQSGNYVNSGCTYIGQRAGYHLKGIYNTCLGLSAGAQQNATGEYNVFIGIQCGIDNTGATSSNPKVVNNSIAIGRQARATKSYQMVLGSSEITEVVMCGNKKIKFNQDGTVTWEQV